MSARVNPERDDPYPTRLVAGAALARPIRRHTPVLRGRPDALVRATGRMDAAHRYETDGFLFLPRFFRDDEVAAWHEEASRLEGMCRETRPDEAFFERADGSLRSLFGVPRFSGVVADLVRDARLTAIVAAILDDAHYLHQVRLNYKPALTGTGFYWHSDFETWHAEDGMPDMHAVSVSIALTDNTAFNGSLMLIPGSHTTFVPCLGATPEDHYVESLVEQKVGTPAAASLAALQHAGGIEMPVGPAGSLVVFDCNTMHGSYGNLSTHARTNLFLVYNARSNALCAPYAAARPRPRFIAERPAP